MRVTRVAVKKPTITEQFIQLPRRHLHLLPRGIHKDVKPALRKHLLMIDPIDPEASFRRILDFHRLPHHPAVTVRPEIPLSRDSAVLCNHFTLDVQIRRVGLIDLRARGEH